MNTVIGQDLTRDFTSLVERVLVIQDITWGNPTSGSPIDGADGKVLVRYRGQLLMDAGKAYEALVSDFRPYRITPLFQRENGGQAIYLIEDEYTAIISEVFTIQETSWRKPDKSSSRAGRFNYLVRYRGQLRIDSEQAYDQVSEQLQPHKLTVMFRNAEELQTQEILLLDGIPKPGPSNPRINLLLFVITLFSVLLSGAIYAYEGPLPDDMLDAVWTLLSNLHLGVPFAVSLLAILLAHEFGHYLAGRYHRTEVTLPYFIPFPLSLLGTLGAFIQLKELPKNKKVLLDIGAAGPLAGFVVAVPVLIIGLMLSEINRIPFGIPGGQALQLEGNSILYLLAKFAVFGELLPAPVNYAGMHPVLYWLRYFFTGEPLPLGGTDVIISPIAWAGWAGLLVTGLNLIPAGQLDGGHLIYSLFGKKARYLVPVILVTLLILGFFWSGWWLYAGLIFFLGRTYAEPLDQITALDRRRKWVAILSLVIFVLVFIPVPLRFVTGGGGF